MMTKSYVEMLAFGESKVDACQKGDILKNSCDVMEYLLDNCEITVPEENRFFVHTNVGYLQNELMWRRVHKIQPEIESTHISRGQKVFAYVGMFDFGHTTTEWDSVIPLGLFGLRERIMHYAKKNQDPAKEGFYQQLLRVYDAVLRFMKRAGDAALAAGKQEIAQSLYRLTREKPANLFEAMQTSILYFILQQFFDGTVLRTLGRLDTLFYPFYLKEEKKHAKALIMDYLAEIDTFGVEANIPFALGGTDVKGNSLVNELSYQFLNAYAEANTINTKLHILCSKNIPDAMITIAFEAIRKGNNSIVFMSDEKIIEGLMKLGESHEDAVDYHVVGCYECGGKGEITCSCNAKINIPKAVEYAMTGGIDMLTGEQIGLPNDGNFPAFEDFYTEFLRQLSHLSQGAMTITDMYERYYPILHAAPLLSGVYTSSLEKGMDLYAEYGAKYNNSSVNGIGLATAVDSLAAIKKLVYEDKTMGLSSLRQILASDWKGNESLRLLIRNKFPKFGTGNADTDALAKRATDALSEYINGKPNVKGGLYRLGLFSINWRWEFGEHTAASADGRHAKETLSQNATATFGADKEGATAHLLSVAVIDASTTPNCTIVDIDLHTSAVNGNNGLNALFYSLKSFFQLGGMAVHYNVLDSTVLQDAKLHPEKYPNLQVRLCGWNVLFPSLSEQEQDEFIARSAK